MFRWIEKWAKAKNPANHTWTTISWLFFWRAWLPWLWFGVFRYRVWGTENIPAKGPVLLICNHQSFFDLFVVGMMMNKRLFMAMARSTLFSNKHFGKLITSLNAVPIKQGGSDRKALMGMVDILNQGACMLVFPEGSRSKDGRTADFQQGISLLIKRAKPTIVPMGLDGAFDAWRMGQKVPKFRGNMGIQIGPPVEADELLKLGNRGALKYLESVVETYRMNVRDRLRADSNQKYPPPGIGDIPSRPILEELRWENTMGLGTQPDVESREQSTEDLAL